MHVVRPVVRLACAFGLGAVLGGCFDGAGPDGNGMADLVVTGASVWTGLAELPDATAVAVRRSQIVYVGDDEGAQAWTGAVTLVVPGGGGSLLPGFQDVHAHPLEAGSLLMADCLLDPEASAESLVPVIQGCAPAAPLTGWVLGAGHSIYALWDSVRTPRQILDEAVPELPAAMLEQTSHSVWVNSAGLAAAGITRDTPDPPGGIIARGGDGEPTGLLLDSAGDAVLEVALAPSPAVDQLNYEGLLWSLGELARFGVTSVAEARTYWTRDYEAIWARAHAAGALSARTTLGWWAYPGRDDDEQLAALAAKFDPGDGFLGARQVKLYSDGIPGNTTAAMLEAYLESPGGVPSLGLNYFDGERLGRYVRELDAAGFDAHIHAIGDRGVRESLDAIESARDAGGTGRHRITHVEYVHPDDLARFAALDVVADVQVSGEWTRPGHPHDDEWLLGSERIEAEYLRLGDLHRSGARVVLSSDWDVGPLNPLVGIRNALERGEDGLPDLATALRAYTSGPAWVLRQEETTGTIEVGKQGDLVLLHRDLFEVPPAELPEVGVRRTWLAGDEVFRTGLQPPL